MIHALLNEGSLKNSSEGAMDPHAVVIPQHEINAYDALNAFYMGADAYSDGDLLVTFPSCKEAKACNPLFRLAAAHSEQNDTSKRAEELSWAHIRLFGPPEDAAKLYESAQFMASSNKQ